MWVVCGAAPDSWDEGDAVTKREHLFLMGIHKFDEQGSFSSYTDSGLALAGRFDFGVRYLLRCPHLKMRARVAAGRRSLRS